MGTGTGAGITDEVPANIPYSWVAGQTRGRGRWNDGTALTSAQITQIAQASTLSRPTVSHHLKLLCEAGVLERARHGREIHFRLRAASLIEHLQSVIDYLEAHR